MSIPKISMLAVAALAWGPNASAASLLPDHVVQAIDAGPSAHAGTPRWVTAQATDSATIAYLAAVASGASVRTRPDIQAARPASLPPAADAAAAAPNPDADAQALLIDALHTLGPMDVSITDYLALALRGLAVGPADAHAVAAPGRPKGSPAAQRSTLDFLPTASAATPPRPARAGRALPTALPEQLTRYLFLAAVAALLAGAGLGLAQWARRSARPSLARH